MANPERFTLTQHAKSNLIRAYYKRLRSLGLRRLRFGDDLVDNMKCSLAKDALILDIGANDGEFASHVLEACPTARIKCFEPGIDAFERLTCRLENSHNVSLHNVAISSTTGTADLHVTELDVGSSLLEPLPGKTRPWLQEVRQETVDTVRLDENFSTAIVSRAFAACSSRTLRGWIMTSCHRWDDFLRQKSSVASWWRSEIFPRITRHQNTPGELFPPSCLPSGFTLASIYPFYTGELPISWCDSLFVARSSRI